MTSNPNKNYVSATYYFDFEEAPIQSILQKYKSASLSPREKAIALYLYVRDEWRYNPYHISFRKEHYKASYLAQQTEGHCLDKSILLIACLRGLGIPARLHLAKVKNHIAVDRLVEKFGSNELSPHGIVSILLEGKWIKASPAFNASLCEKCNVEPLDFNGIDDSIFQQYDKDGAQFMEYLEDYGHFPDVPMAFIRENMLTNYPNLKHMIDDQGKLQL